MNKKKVGILGATGMVGQRFITLLNNHPWFEVVALAASPRSANMPYHEAVMDRWMMHDSIPDNIKNLKVLNVQEIEQIKPKVDFVFSAINMDKEEIQALESAYAENDIPVVSNNSAHRWTNDVPMIIPEVNPHHVDLIPIQQNNYNWQKGFIAVKPNCSIQSYVPALAPLMEFNPTRMIVATEQAISGAGKDFDTWPEINDNVIPYIGGENEKSEQEPLKIFGVLTDQGIKNHTGLKISAQCNRVPVSDGHMANVFVEFEEKPTIEQIIKRWEAWAPESQTLNLPSAPNPTLIYQEESDRPQTNLDRNNGNGMAITLGGLRECNVFDYRFNALSHNTIRGAAGGAILVAELLQAKGYLI